MKRHIFLVLLCCLAVSCVEPKGPTSFVGFRTLPQPPNPGVCENIYNPRHYFVQANLRVHSAEDFHISKEKWARIQKEFRVVNSKHDESLAQYFLSGQKPIFPWCWEYPEISRNGNRIIFDYSSWDVKRLQDNGILSRVQVLEITKRALNEREVRFSGNYDHWLGCKGECPKYEGLSPIEKLDSVGNWKEGCLAITHIVYPLGLTRDEFRRLGLSDDVVREVRAVHAELYPETYKRW